MTRGGFSSLAVMSGWLFADLLLVLFLILLGTVPGKPAPIPSTPPSTSPSVPARTPPSRPPKTSCPQSFELKPQRFDINGVSLRGLATGNGEVRRELIGSMRRQIAARGLQDQYAGLVLAFGKSPNSSRGTARAAALNGAKFLKKDLKKFSRVQIKEFNYESDQTNALIIYVYFFVEC